MDTFKRKHNTCTSKYEILRNAGPRPSFPIELRIPNRNPNHKIAGHTICAQLKPGIEVKWKTSSGSA